MQEVESAIKSGWQGNINGHVENTSSHIEVSQVTLKLDSETAYALCNLLIDSALETAAYINAPQRKSLSQLGAALGRMVDHNAANNGGRPVIK